MEKETLRAEREITWGSEAASEGGGAPEGLRTSPLFVGGRGVIISAEEMTPPDPTPAREVPRPRIRLRDPRRPSPSPLPVLADPSAWSDCGAFKTFAAAHAQLFVCCWSFSLLRKKEEIGWRMGRREGRGER